MGHAALYHADRFWKERLIGPMKRRVFLALMLLPTLAHAHSTKFGNIGIGHSWALPTVTQEAQVMMPLVNNASITDSLISASTPIATSVELRNADDAETEFVLDPHMPFPMRAAANHLQLLGLSKPLTKGDMFPLILKFKTAGEIEIQIRVADKAGE
jgi:copper(I)-binding protein